jgi:hypothetical protein
MNGLTVIPQERAKRVSVGAPWAIYCNDIIAWLGGTGRAHKALPTRL